MLPLYLRIVVGALALANVGYGIAGYFKPSQIFENSTEGVDSNGAGARYAGYEYASRNLAIGIGMLVAAVMDSAPAIAVTTAIRAFVEVQSIAINTSLKKFNEGFFTAAAFLAIELFILVVLYRLY